MIPIDQVYEQIAQFASDAGAQKVILFGSRVKGTNRPKSGIDVAIAGCPDSDTPLNSVFRMNCGHC